MNLLPPLQCGGGALALLQGRPFAQQVQCAAVSFWHGLAEAVPQVPAVAGLDRRWQRLADGLAVRARSVTAYDLDPGMIPQPLFGGADR